MEKKEEEKPPFAHSSLCCCDRGKQEKKRGSVRSRGHHRLTRTKHVKGLKRNHTPTLSNLRCCNQIPSIAIYPPLLRSYHTSVVRVSGGPISPFPWAINTQQRTNERGNERQTDCFLMKPNAEWAREQETCVHREEQDHILLISPWLWCCKLWCERANEVTQMRKRLFSS